MSEVFFLFPFQRRKSIKSYGFYIWIWLILIYMQKVLDSNFIDWNWMLNFTSININWLQW